MGRGFAQLDEGLTKASCKLLNISKLVQRLQNVQKVANLERGSAYRMGYITKEQVHELSAMLKKNRHGQYLLRLIGRSIMTEHF